MLTVGEFITELQKLDPCRVLVMAKDAEGNGFSPLGGLWEGAYKPDSTWSGQVGFESPASAVANGYDAFEDVLEGGQPCVVLTPVN